MTWEEKLQAIRSLDSETHLRMRKPGDWYVASQIEVGGDGILSGAYGDDPLATPPVVTRKGR